MKRVSRSEVLASMDSTNFRIDRVESTSAELRHAKMRVNTMTYPALERRIAVMQNPLKLIATIRALSLRGLKNLARDARMKLDIILDHKAIERESC